MWDSSSPCRYLLSSAFLKTWLSQVSYSPGFERDMGKYISDMRKTTAWTKRKWQLITSTRRHRTRGARERAAIFSGHTRATLLIYQKSEIWTEIGNWPQASSSIQKNKTAKDQEKLITYKLSALNFPIYRWKRCHQNSVAKDWNY